MIRLFSNFEGAQIGFEYPVHRGRAGHRPAHRHTNAFGPGAALASVAASGFADAHSGAISAAILERNEVLSLRAAQIAVLLGFTTNAITKIIVSAVTGPRGYLWRVAGGVVASVSAAWVVLWVFDRSG